MQKKTKTKPKCTGGYSCGWACISKSRICRSEISKDNAQAILDAVKARVLSNKASKKDLTLAEQAAALLDDWQPTTVSGQAAKNPLKPGQITVADFDRPEDVALMNSMLHLEAFPGYSEVAYVIENFPDVGVRNLTKDLSAALADGYSEAEVILMARAVRAWFGNGYAQLSQLTYKSYDELAYSKVKSLDMKARILNIAVTAMRYLPKANLADLNETLDEKRDIVKDKVSKASESDYAVTSRWLDIKAPNMLDFLSKYSEGSSVTEDGMFGTSHLPAKQMQIFSRRSNVTMKVTRKPDGQSSAIAADRYKSEDMYEGELFYAPGQKFRVDSVKAKVGSTKVQGDQIAKYTELGALLDKSRMKIGANTVLTDSEYDSAMAKYEELGIKPFFDPVSKKQFDMQDLEQAMQDLNSGKSTIADFVANGFPASILESAGPGKGYVLANRYSYKPNLLSDWQRAIGNVSVEISLTEI